MAKKGAGKRSYGEGSVYLRGNTWWYKFYFDGQKIERSSGSKDREVALNELKIAKGELAKGGVPTAVFGKTRFGRLAELIINDYKIKQRKTLNKVRERLNNDLGPYFGRLRAKDITSERISRYIELQLDRGKSPATINRQLSILKRMFKLGKRQTPPLVQSVPYIPKLEEDNVREDFLTDDDYVNLLQEAVDYLKPVITFAYWYGWRKEEILGLTWDKVDLEHGTVRLERGRSKSRKAREIPLFPDVLEMLVQVWNDQQALALTYKSETGNDLQTEYVFTRLKGSIKIREQKGEEIHYLDRIKSHYGAWRVACKKIGREGAWLHDFRRTAARNMVRMGIPQVIAMEITGHKTREIFDRYNIVDIADLQVAADTFQRHSRGRIATKIATNGKNKGQPKIDDLHKPS